jgi:hypothetical protein
MTTFTSDDAEYAKRHTCEHCKQTLEIDAVHKCKPQERLIQKILQQVADSSNYLDAVNRDEARYNAKMGRSGVRWAGD